MSTSSESTLACRYKKDWATSNNVAAVSAVGSDS